MVRFSRSLRICVALFLASAPGLGIVAQTAPPAVQAPAQEPPIIPHAPPTPAATEGGIHLDVVVTDKSGNPVSGLEQSDFTLLDNNQPTRILSFHAVEGPIHESGLPAQAFLVMDAANSPFQEVARERGEIDTFLRRNGGHLSLPVSILVFSDSGMKLLVQPSMDGNAVAAQLDQAESALRSLTRAAGFNGAIERLQLSLKALHSLVAALSAMPGRKLLIWVGGAWPLFDSPALDASPKGYDEMFDAVVHMSADLRAARISVYNVALGLPNARTFLYQDFVKGVKSSKQVNLGNLSVKVFAVQSGGLVLSPTNDLASELSTCVQDAVPFYTLTFDPPRPEKPNEYHDLKVRIAKPGLAARTNTGYYDQP